MMQRADLPTPCYIIDEAKLRSNLELLHNVEQETGAHILLAQKAFSCFAVYPVIAQYLSGTTASGLYEARLGAEEFKKENHVFSPAYDPAEFRELCRICDHISFNSFTQLEKYRPVWEQAGVSVGIRVNPEAMVRQLKERGQEWKADLYFHRRLIAGELPQTIGGGIGQSRLCMYLLRKAHIGEIQSSIWPEAMREACHGAGIELA